MLGRALSKTHELQCFHKTQASHDDDRVEAFPCVLWYSLDCLSPPVRNGSLVTARCSVRETQRFQDVEPKLVGEHTSDE